MDPAKMRRQVIVERSRHRNASVDGLVGFFHFGNRYGPFGQVVLIERQRIGPPTVCETAPGERAVGEKTVGDKAPKRVIG